MSIDLDFEDLTCESIEQGHTLMPDGSYEKVMRLYGCNLPPELQGFAMYKGNPIFPEYNVVGFNKNITYPKVKNPRWYVEDHEEKVHIRNKKRPSLMAIKRALGPDLGHWFEEYVTRLVSDGIYEGRTGEFVNTAGDIEIFN